MSLNLEDIARLAGVSRSTVSRVINNHPNVRETTKEKVLSVIHEQNFHPNPVARMLATQRAQIIGIVISQSATVFFNDSSSYFPTLIQGVAEVANERNYNTLLWLSSGTDSEENFYRRIIHNRLMDGLLILSASSSHMLVSHLVETNIPFICIERPPRFADYVTYVTIDNIESAKTAVQHLIEQGRKCIGAITGPMDNPDSADRLIGYRAALEEAGLPLNPNWIFVAHFTIEAGYEGAQALLSQGIDAIFAGSDQIAVGVYQALRDAGRRVPEDIAVIGFDDLPQAAALTPQLTTVHHPIRNKGAVATRLLLDWIEGDTRQPQRVILPTNLVVRQSSGALTHPIHVNV
jgi:LacI family transcriptional regulator